MEIHFDDSELSTHHPKFDWDMLTGLETPNTILCQIRSAGRVPYGAISQEILRRVTGAVSLERSFIPSAEEDGAIQLFPTQELRITFAAAMAAEKAIADKTLLSAVDVHAAAARVALCETIYE